MSPTKIEIQNNYLIINWDDEKTSKIKLTNLRKNCPCALCISEKEKQGSKYIPLYSGDELKVTEIKVVGHYAVGINWKDGHNTGIYEFAHLKSLSDKE